MKRLVCYTVLVVLCFLQTAFAANLIENGDFEAPRVTWLYDGGTNNLYYNPPGGNANTPPLDFKWKVSSFNWGDYVYQIGTKWNGASGLSGDQSVDIQGNSILFQDFTTVIGQQYDLNFWYANNPTFNSNGTSAKIINVIGSGLTPLLSEIVSHSGSALDNMNFTEYSGRFIADSLSTRLAFKGDWSGTPRTDYGFVVDNVSVNATPEPVSAALFIFGAGALSLRRYRKRVKL